MTILDKKIFLELDEDLKQLLELTHYIKANFTTQTFDKEKLNKALLLANKIEAELYQLMRLMEKGDENLVHFRD